MREHQRCGIEHPHARVLGRPGLALLWHHGRQFLMRGGDGQGDLVLVGGIDLGERLTDAGPRVALQGHPAPGAAPRHGPDQTGDPFALAGRIARRILEHHEIGLEPFEERLELFQVVRLLPAGDVLHAPVDEPQRSLEDGVAEPMGGREDI